MAVRNIKEICKILHMLMCTNGNIVKWLRQLTNKVELGCSDGYKRYGAVAFTKPSMGNLSRDRTEGVWAFQVIGIDLSGWWG